MEYFTSVIVKKIKISYTIKKLKNRGGADLHYIVHKTFQDFNQQIVRKMFRKHRWNGGKYEHVSNLYIWVSQTRSV